MSNFGFGSFGTGTFGGYSGTVVELPGISVTVGAAAVAESADADFILLDRSTGGLQVTLLKDYCDSPGVLSANILNGDIDGYAYFFLDDATEYVARVRLDSGGSARNVQVPVQELAAGPHLVGASKNTTPPNSGFVPFTVQSSYDSVVIVPEAGTEPPMPNVVNKWVFQAYDFTDVNAVDTYILPINPNVIQRSFGEVNITSEPTTVSNGRVISWEGQAPPPQWSFSGVTLTEADTREIVRWGRTGQRFYITDHFGQRYLAKVLDFSIKRRRDIARPWHHTYDFKVAVLGGVGVF